MIYNVDSNIVNRFLSENDNNIKKSENSKEAENKKLKNACVEFESILVNQMLKSMRKTIDKNDLFNESSLANEVFEDMLYEEYAKEIARSGNFGLSDVLYKNLASK